jgi:hypothetical protein
LPISVRGPDCRPRDRSLAGVAYHKTQRNPGFCPRSPRVPFALGRTLSGSTVSLLHCSNLTRFRACEAPDHLQQALDLHLAATILRRHNSAHNYLSTWRVRDSGTDECPESKVGGGETIQPPDRSAKRRAAQPRDAVALHHQNWPWIFVEAAISPKKPGISTLSPTI